MLPLPRGEGRGEGEGRVRIENHVRHVCNGMNPEIPRTPQEALEAKLTALLLGELPADEAFTLGRSIEQDADLAKLYTRLNETVGLVQEATVSPAEQSSPSPVLKLSEPRREKLLSHFKTVAPKQFAEPERHATSWFVPLAAAAVVMLFGLLALPNFQKARTTSQSNAIINNLRQLDGAKQQWAIDNHKFANVEPTLKDLTPYLRSSGMKSVAGEKYVVGKVGEPVAADLDSGRAKKAFHEYAGTRLLSRGKDQRLQLIDDNALAMLPNEGKAATDAPVQLAVAAPLPAKSSEADRTAIALSSMSCNR